VPEQVLAPARIHDLRSDLDLHADGLQHLLDLTARVKKRPQRYSQALTGKYLSLLFEKPSLRTRFTFELAIKQLGGDAVTAIGPIADREPIKDVARNLDRWTDAIVARVFSQQTIDELAEWSSVPVVNALSDLYHPCQALADVFTLQENFGNLSGLKLAYVGDGNNVAHSLLLCGARLGMHISVATPPGYEPDRSVVSQALEFAKQSRSRIEITHSALAAVEGAAAVYTDVWASMGQESERDQRRRRFEPYQVNEGLMNAAVPGALFMHCLPAKRGEETTDAIAEKKTSIIFDQAENRLHAQKALLLMLIGQESAERQARTPVLR
jgi:ornithine carbamoyltransferase